MADRYGQFTVRGSAAIERLMTDLVDEAANRVNEAISPAEYRALVMMGGYGRGEGGVEIVDGTERPHNNLDFMLIANTARPSELCSLRERLSNSLLPVMQKYDIEIDFSVVSIWKLRLSPPLIIWYDMRFGHKTVLGDAEFVPSLTRFRVDTIPSRDALRLLVNRGTLLVINEQLLDEEGGGADHRRRMIRNIMKAIIGYGDALLFFWGAYHWSYVERQQRMQSHAGVLDDFRALYDEAAAFRLQPNYQRYESRDLRDWMAELRPILERVHRSCECRRLGVTDFTWDQYPGLAARHALSEEPLSARAWARKAVHLSRGATQPTGLGTRARLGYRAMGAKDRSMLAFPFLAYHLEGPSLEADSAAALSMPAASGRSALREAYLRLWCGAIDVNAESALRTWHMPAAKQNGEGQAQSSQGPIVS